jgi:hypothetical protein
MLPVEQPFKTYTGLDGKPLTNGSVYFGVAGMDPITHPVTVFWDAAGTLPAAQPIRTVNGYLVNDANAPANVFYSGAYSETVIDSKGRTVFYAPNSNDFSVASFVSTYLNSISGAGGSSLMGFQASGTGAAVRTVQDKLRESVSVDDYFLAAEADSTGMIQRAINTGAGRIELMDKNYNTSAPIYLDGGQELRGKGRGKTTITKTTTTVGTGSNKAPARTTNDTYDKNAIIICRHPSDDYNYGTSIVGMTLKSNGYIVQYGIFAPRMSQWHMEDVYIYQCQYGVVTNDAWLSKFDKVVCDANTRRGLQGQTYGWGSAAVGFWWQNDGSNNATGTSLSASNCWARDCDIGWLLYGLKYSALVGCAADNISDCAYKFDVSDISMVGCGHENVQVGTGYGAAIHSTFSNISMQGCDSLLVYGSAAGTTSWLFLDSGSMSIRNSVFADFTSPGTSYNRIVQNGAKLTLDGVTLPANGNSFVTYAGGAQELNLSSVPPSIKSAIASGAPRYMAGRVRDNELLQSVGKVIASGGTAIATLTCTGSAGIEQAAVRFEITWYDTTFQAGIGIANLEALVYQDGGVNYRDALNTSVNIYAGNGMVTAPTFTLSRSGNVWTLTMTPAYGAAICNTITARVENCGGFTVALP